MCRNIHIYSHNIYNYILLLVWSLFPLIFFNISFGSLTSTLEAFLNLRMLKFLLIFKEIHKID